MINSQYERYHNTAAAMRTAAAYNMVTSGTSNGSGVGHHHPSLMGAAAAVAARGHSAAGNPASMFSSPMNLNGEW